MPIMATNDYLKGKSVTNSIFSNAQQTALYSGVTSPYLSFVFAFVIVFVFESCI